MQPEIRPPIPSLPPPIAFGSAETRIRVSAIGSESCSRLETKVTRSLHPGWSIGSTTDASGLGRFLSVDPVSDVKTAMSNPQAWNRYTYVMNNPVGRTDPDGKCSKPATKEGQVGICVEGFIAKLAVGLFGIGRGDNRGFAANDPSKTNRVQVQIVVDTKTGKIVATTRAAQSSVAMGSKTWSRQGTATTTLSNATRQPDGTIKFSTQTNAVNGFAGYPGAPKGSIGFRFNFVVTSEGNVGLDTGGATKGYPSVAAYGYDANGSTVKLFEHPEHEIEDLQGPQNVPVPAVPPE